MLDVLAVLHPLVAPVFAIRLAAHAPPVRLELGLELGRKRVVDGERVSDELVVRLAVQPEVVNGQPRPQLFVQVPRVVGAVAGRPV